MHRRVLTTSFFDNDNISKKQKQKHFYQYKDKENDHAAKRLPHVVSETRKIAETTLSKLNSFALPQNANESKGILANSRTPKKGSNTAAPVISGKFSSSQGEDRVKWRITPPPSNVQLSNQKLSINEMFDIFQASQHSTETPVRHLDRSNDLWSRYDSAEPLPYLDLELSPSSRGTPRSESKLRRTTSLPAWKPNQNERKRKRKSNSSNTMDGKVQSMIERMENALVKETSITLPHEPDSPKIQIQISSETVPSERTAQILSSDNFGDDTLDDHELVALMKCVSPCAETVRQQLCSKKLKAVPDVVEDDSPKLDVVVNENQNAGTDDVSVSVVQGQDVHETSSDYSIDLDETDFLEASQLVHECTNKDENKCGKAMVPDILQGLDDDAFSDFELPDHEDVTIHQILAVENEKYTQDNRNRTRKCLTIRAQDGSLKKAFLEDDWAFLELEANDTLRCHGSWSSPSLYIATNQHGLVIAHPDVLVSSTSIADSHTCLRKSVLQDRVRATSFLSKALIFGSILHSLMQESLSKQDFSDESMRREIDVQVAGNLENLYLVDEALETAKDYLYSKVVLLQQWAARFVGPDRLGRVEPMHGDNVLQQVAVGVRSSLDIEERFWSPLYGLKGNVDVTAEICLSIDHQTSVLTAPLEFKTGKAEYLQTSHRAQVMLYTLMVSDRYKIDVPAGFLYYLESGQMTRVAALHNELRGLIIMRNELAGHMKNKNMPSMISNKRLCGSCYAAEPCLIYQQTAQRGKVLSGSISEPWFAGKVSHMTETEIQFFNKWESLITKEEGQMFQFRHELWQMTSREREDFHRCFGSLSVVPGSESFDSSFGKAHQWTYKLRHTSDDKIFTKSEIADHEPIVISAENGAFAISCGFVSNISSHTITVNVDRPLRDSRSRIEDFDETINQTFRGLKAAASSINNVIYRIDRDEFKNGMGLVRNNLISLFLDPAGKKAAPNTERFKDVIVNLTEPKFDPKSVTMTNKSQRESDLNVDQIKAKDLVLSARDYALILGMPGTGKTTTISQIIGKLVEAGKSVLLTSYTHSAVDTILLKLARHNIKILRLGNASKVHPDVLRLAQTERHTAETFEQLHEHYMCPNVVATTCLSINHAIFQRRRFDYCIFDEASQATLPVCLGPLRFADRFVLVGDHYQLPPLVRDSEARKLGLDVSLFKILCEAHPRAVVELKHQYRMNYDIMSVSNRLIYGQRMICGSKMLEKRKITNIDLKRLIELHDVTQVPYRLCEGRACWLEYTLEPKRRVVYLNTDSIIEAQETVINDCIQNEGESLLVTQLIAALSQCGLPESEIGVISPYRSQLRLLHKQLGIYPGIVIDTADKFQGRDKECILISLVRSNSSRNIGELLRDWRRINVAFTRAKSKMIIIGSQTTLANDKLLNDFLQLVHYEGWAYDLPSDALMRHEITPSTLRTASQRNACVTSQVNPTGVTGRKTAARETKLCRIGERAMLTNKPILRDVLSGFE